MPLVSVIVPFYNSRITLERAVSSVLEQTVTDFELVLVDDGSGDRSGALALEMAARDHSRVRVIVQEHKGVSAARNRGVAETNSPLLAFLDADDQWKPDFLKVVLDLRERFPDCGIWAARYEIRSASGKTRLPELKGVPQQDGLIGDFLATAPGAPPVCTGSAVIRRDRFLEAGGFPEGVRWGEDLDTWLRLALAWPVALSAKTGLVCHLDHPERAGRSGDQRSYPLLSREVEARYGEKLPSAGRRALTEYFHWMRLTAAQDCLRLGQRRTARCLLRLSEDTIPHRSLWRRAWARSLLPPGLMRLLALLRADF